MKWRMAKSLEVLLAQINALAPNRSKASDGGIGNAEHSARDSDHNPDDDGVVKARDFTHDPAHGVDSQKLAEMLIASRDPRIKYVISNRRIANSEPVHGAVAWFWRIYIGKNPHDHHVHVSVKKDAAHYDDETRWALTLSPPVAGAAPAIPVLAPLRRGANGVEVMRLQDRLNHHGALLIRDGDFGGVTESAVKIFQKNHSLVADGAVGRYTWDALNG